MPILNNLERARHHSEDLADILDLLDNPETLYAEDVRDLVDYGCGWKTAAALSEMRAG